MCKTADEARSKSLKCIDINQLNHIRELMDIEIQKGKTSMGMWTCDVPDNIIERLSIDGFVITKMRSDKESLGLYKISWSKVNIIDERLF